MVLGAATLGSRPRLILEPGTVIPSSNFNTGSVGICARTAKGAASNHCVNCRRFNILVPRGDRCPSADNKPTNVIWGERTHGAQAEERCAGAPESFHLVSSQLVVQVSETRNSGRHCRRHRTADDDECSSRVVLARRQPRYLRLSGLETGGFASPPYSGFAFAGRNPSDSKLPCQYALAATMRYGFLYTFASVVGQRQRQGWLVGTCRLDTGGQFASK